MKLLKNVAALVAALLLCHNVMAQSPYISRVFAFQPAPGQFVHVYPQVAAGSDSVAVAQIVEAQLAGTNQGMVSLGGFGGYIVMGFDQDVINHVGQCDFKVLGNAFYSTIRSASEAGVVMVSDDVNGNGLPDDAWYEIKGNVYDSCVRNYAVTYYRPSAEDDAATGNIANYIRWRDNQGAEGYVSKNNFHAQSYYPLWYGDSVTFNGTLIPETEKYNCKTGYCDVAPNDSVGANIDIDWAVKADGTPANLTKIRFVRVHTGRFFEEAMFGEVSTECCGAMILTPTVGMDNVHREDLKLINNQYGIASFVAPEQGKGTLFSLTGCQLRTFDVVEGYNEVMLTGLANGVYVLRVECNTQTYTLKVIKQ